MKNLIDYFTPRDNDEKNSLLGMIAGLLVLAVIFYFYSL